MRWKKNTNDEKNDILLSIALYPTRESRISKRQRTDKFERQISRKLSIVYSEKYTSLVSVFQAVSLVTTESWLKNVNHAREALLVRNVAVFRHSRFCRRTSSVNVQKFIFLVFSFFFHRNYQRDGTTSLLDLAHTRMVPVTGINNKQALPARGKYSSQDTSCFPTEKANHPHLNCDLILF